MNNLAMDLQRLTLRSGEGSFTTRVQRHRGLQLISRELKALGYTLPDARSLKPKHIRVLIAKWQGDDLAAGTLKNRMSWIRWWAACARKTSVVASDNAELGIGQRESFKGNRAHAPTPAQKALLEERMQLIVDLQLAFGLRLEESLKFRPRVADAGDRIQLQASWCKGGRAREVEITHARQRALLDRVRTLCGDGSLIPADTSYISFKKAVERATRNAGIRNLHGHRHWYAQWRYRVLTGRAAPAAGGDPYALLSRTERALDARARLQVSRELGHERLDVTNVYLGRRAAGRTA